VELVAQASKRDRSLSADDGADTRAHLADGVDVGVHVAPDPHREAGGAQRLEVLSVVAQLSAGRGLVASGAQAPGERDGSGVERWRDRVSRRSRRDLGISLRRARVRVLAALDAGQAMEQVGPGPVTPRSCVEHDPAAERVRRGDPADDEPVAVGDEQGLLEPQLPVAAGQRDQAPGHVARAVMNLDASGG
jgi:hypothetical protein